MSSKDLISIGQLILGLVCGTGMLILLNRNKSSPKIWPRILGLGGALYLFVASMIGSVLLRPVSEIVDYTISNFFWSIMLGIVSYFSGHILARRFGKQ